MILLVLLFAAVAVGMVLVFRGTLKKTKWGINATSVSCPNCKTFLPSIREPQSLRQALWGGSTCTVCGTEVDKWGRDNRSF